MPNDSATSDAMVDAVIVAGGAGRRLGQDKALVARPGGRQVDHVVACLRPLGGRIVVAHGARPLAVPDTISVNDEPGRVGPLAGVVAGLRALAGEDERAADDVPAALVAVDLVHPHAGLLRALAAHVGRHDLPGAMPVVAGRGQPLHAVVRIGLVAELAAVSGDRLVPALVAVGVASVPEATWRGWHPDARPSADLDTPADLAALRETVERPDAGDATR